MLPLCPYHNRFWKKLVEFFYHIDTVDGGCLCQVVDDNTRNCFVHEITNYDLVFFTSVEENVKTFIVEEPLHRDKKVDGTIRNTDHTTTVRWSYIVKNGGPGSIGDEISSKEKSS